jgi:Kef-type K+ transport system membrane component KefB
VQIAEVAVFVPLIVIGVSRAGAWILNKLRNNQAGDFIVMLGIMVVAGVLADFINLPDIVGAFLAGWAVNGAADGHPAKEKLVFFGKALFIPIFFIVTGFLIVPVAVGHTILNSFWLVVGMIGSLILGKGIAASGGRGCCITESKDEARRIAVKRGTPAAAAPQGGLRMGQQGM